MNKFKKRYRLLIINLILLLCICGCTKSEKWETDQKLRRTIFLECMKALPNGPEETMYNDWAEVVDECGDQAYLMARKCIFGCTLK